MNKKDVGCHYTGEKTNSGMHRVTLSGAKKIELLRAMKTVVNMFIDDSAKGEVGAYDLFFKYCPTDNELEKLSSTPADDFPDMFDKRFMGACLFFFVLMRDIGKATIEAFVDDVSKMF